MEKLKNISVADCVQSETNTKGRTDGEAFRDLVASVKESGVLVPVLARQMPARMAKGKKELHSVYEVIAGNRRLAAAKAAGLKEIPAQIVEMNDQEARQAQIVENLQRQDIHPIEEAVAYRALVLNGADVKDVAIRVGKSDTYVRDRLFLTNLIGAAQRMYREGRIMDGHAVLIAKLSATDQPKALEYAADEWDRPSTKDLKEWIDREFNSPMAFQPWAKSDVKMPTHLKSCHPNDAALFGDLKEGVCTDLACWQAHMMAWITARLEKVREIVPITDNYGKSEWKGALNRGQYGEASGKKATCKYARPAIYVEGSIVGKETLVCIEPKCKKHFGSKDAAFEASPKEVAAKKAARKAELAAAKKKDAAFEKRITDAVAAVAWPLKDRELDALVELAFNHSNSNGMRAYSKRHALLVEKKKQTYGASYYDHEGAVKKYAKDLGATDKVRLAFELLVDTGYGSVHPGINKLEK